MMPLDNGHKLGPYEISGLLGQGGMGEVYRARDLRLDRTVAVKTLHPELSGEAQFRDRFVREAKVISALSHPNICTLYDVGQTGDLSYLVMEYISGATLAERLKTGAMPLAEALACAGQVASALDHAHRKGVVHRDLKPGNIVLTKTGAKLLDFGIAKLLHSAPEAVAPGPHTMTSAGMVVGTLHYMAPEQLQAMEVDGRADLFALGAVLYEMLLGVKAFDGRSQATIISMIIGGQPERMADLSQVGPPEVERLLRRCLAKDPDERWQTARDLESELRWLGEKLVPSRTDHSAVAAQAPAVVAALPAAAKRNIGPWVVAGVMTAVACAALAMTFTRGGVSAATGGPVTQFALHDPAATVVLDGMGGSAISPDGRHVAFVALREGRPVLAVRALDSLALRAIEGTEDAAYPFWSTDSKWVGFFAGEKLRKAPLSGGAPQTICDAANPRGGTWAGETIVFAAGEGGLSRVADAGGNPAPLTTLNPAEKEMQHGWPEFLPDGKSLLYHVRSAKAQSSHVRVADLHGGGSGTRVIQSNHRAVFDAYSRRLLYLKSGTLLAQAFDPAAKSVTGEPSPVVAGVASQVETGYAGFSVSAAGVLLHRSGGSGERKLRWVGRDGATLEEIGEARHYATARLSADKDTLIVSEFDADSGQTDLWMIDPVGKLRTRLTLDENTDTAPVWAPGEDHIAFASGSTVLSLFRKPLADLSSPVRLGGEGPSRRPTDWSRDGQWIVYEETGAQTRGDVWRMPASGGGAAVPLLQTRFHEYQGQLSPDGKLLAYTSEETGRPEVYVRGVEDRGAPLRVSPSGGSQPRWRGDGKEVYYVAGDGRMKAAQMVPGHQGRPGVAAPVSLFEMTPLGPGVTDYRYDVNNDGSRFLLIVPADAGRQFLTVTLNWAQLLQ